MAVAERVLLQELHHLVVDGLSVARARHLRPCTIIALAALSLLFPPGQKSGGRGGLERRDDAQLWARRSTPTTMHACCVDPPHTLVVPRVRQGGFVRRG